ncbi:DUF2909 domain-containing protein [Thalassotalea mangrovi]|uniref:DUF2909 domain-containing protein n=1 Tax=Thalassotalea mangrovi TaxID=2572245 RepID=UPI0024829FB8|nr:DUF2909 domain-containing protein [Thalassotalea mangrovi]
MNTLFKILILVLLVTMIYNLVLAMRQMIKKPDGEQKMSKFIGRRVMLSALIILLILIGMATGVITPNPRPF